MVTVNVSAAGKPIALARGLPMLVQLPGKQIEDATIADVKSAITQKYPKVFSLLQSCLTVAYGYIRVLPGAPKDHLEGFQEYSGRRSYIEGCGCGRRRGVVRERPRPTNQLENCFLG